MAQVANAKAGWGSRPRGAGVPDGSSPCCRLGGLPLPTGPSPAKEGVLEHVEVGGSGGGLEQRHVHKRFSEKPLRVVKSSRKGLAGLCFLEAAPVQPSLQSRRPGELLGLAAKPQKRGTMGRRPGAKTVTMCGGPASSHAPKPQQPRQGGQRPHFPFIAKETEIQRSFTPCLRPWKAAFSRPTRPCERL